MSSAGDAGGPSDRFPPPTESTEVSEGIHAYIQHDGSWWINNTGFLVGRRGVTSVDACSTQARTDTYRQAIARVTDRPVTTLLNTHHHGDHTFGNSRFAGATVIGQDRLRAALLSYGLPASAPYWEEVDWGDVELTPPTITFADSISVFVDDLHCEFRHTGTAAHTDNDSYLWIPERRVLFSGDLLFNGGTPFMVQGSLTGMHRALDQLEALGAQTIVPGHGQVCGPEVIGRVRSYVQFVQATAAAGRAAGLSPLDVARETDLGEFAGLLDAERLVGNLHRAYAELDGAAPRDPIDVEAALSDMVTFNGGRPLQCHA